MIGERSVHQPDQEEMPGRHFITRLRSFSLRASIWASTCPRLPPTFTTTIVNHAANNNLTTTRLVWGARVQVVAPQ